MTRQQAQRRNFLKYRLSGIQINSFENSDILHNEELITINLINDNIKKLMNNWDDSTKQMTSKNSSVHKKYKCWCGKRTNIPRIILNYDNTEIFACKKHFDEMKECKPDRIVENKNK